MEGRAVEVLNAGEGEGGIRMPDAPVPDLTTCDDQGRDAGMESEANVCGYGSSYFYIALGVLRRHGQLEVLLASTPSGRTLFVVAQARVASIWRLRVRHTQATPQRRIDGSRTSAPEWAPVGFDTHDTLRPTRVHGTAALPDSLGVPPHIRAREPLPSLKAVTRCPWWGDWLLSRTPPSPFSSSWKPRTLRGSGSIRTASTRRPGRRNSRPRTPGGRRSPGSRDRGTP